MDEGTKPSAGVSGSKAILIAAAVSAVAGFGAIYLTLRGSDNARAPVAPPAVTTAGAQTATSTPSELPVKGGLAALATGQMTAFVAKAAPEALPELIFDDDSGKAVDLKEWRGRVVLLNLWATWCAPCLREMPALDKLKTELADKDFDVVALNIDKGGTEKPKKFLRDTGIKALALYHDREGKAFAGLKIIGMPTTLLIGRDGRELGRLIGPAEWDSDDAKALIKAAIGK